MAGSIDDGMGRGRSEREPTLSVVVITYNERDRIEACLQSITDACASLDAVEVVLVDSRSSDDTVDLAREFPVTILRLPATPDTTPGAGRYVGTAATAGDLVLFVDGDMILEDDWLVDACRRVRETPSLAGVDGYLTEPVAEEARPIDVLRGVALYDRAALTEVGGFDPFLHGLEDIDVSYRLDAAGYDLCRLPRIVARHPSRETTDRRRRWANGYYQGRGELLRKYVTRPRLFGRLCYRARLYLLIAGWVALGPLLSVGAGSTGLIAWALGSGLGFTAGAAIQGIDWTVNKLIASALVMGGIAAGFPGTHASPETYPLDAVETIQSAGTQRREVRATR